MSRLHTFTRKELKTLKAKDFTEGDVIYINDKFGEQQYTIYISFGKYSLPLKTTVEDKNFNTLNCTAGTKGGWPYYIADFIHS
jgi:hypothetical protein